MKLTEEEQKKLDEIKNMISVEREYSNNFQYPLILEKEKNNFGFINIIPISIILVIVVVILIIIF